MNPLPHLVYRNVVHACHHEGQKSTRNDGHIHFIQTEEHIGTWKIIKYNYDPDSIQALSLKMKYYFHPTINFQNIVICTFCTCVAAILDDSYCSNKLYCNVCVKLSLPTWNTNLLLQIYSKLTFITCFLHPIIISNEFKIKC